MFPSLVNSCTIDWFTEWPDDALEMVAVKSLEDLDIDEEARRACVLMCVHFHQVMLRKKEDLSPYSILCMCKIHVAFCAHALMTSRGRG